MPNNLPTHRHTGADSPKVKYENVDEKSHKASHENGGDDEINVAGLSGELADNQPPKAHKTSHQDGGSDEMDLTGLSGVQIIKAFTAAHAITAKKAVALMTNGKIIEAFANTVVPDTAYLKFIGFAPSAISKDASGDIVMGGIISGLSGLTIGAIYYLKNTAASASEDITQTDKDDDVVAQSWCQTFIPLQSIIIAVKVWISNTHGSQNWDVTLTLYSGAHSTGSPGTQLATKAVQINAGTDEERTYTFAAPVFVTPGITHTIKLTAVNQCIHFHHNNGGGYADGYCYEQNQPETPEGDFYFKINEKSGDGEIDDSAGNNTKKVGIAISATELLILNTI